jgi:hypothetical protein
MAIYYAHLPTSTYSFERREAGEKKEASEVAIGMEHSDSARAKHSGALRGEKDSGALRGEKRKDIGHP